MADVITTAASLDASQIALMDKAFYIGAGDQIVIDPLIDYKKQIGAASIGLTKYAKLSKATTPLIDGEDVDAVGIDDSKVVFTPEEYGKVVTKTKLASIQTGGKADLAAARLVGINMGETMNALGINAGKGSTNVRIANGVASEGALTVNDYIKQADLNYVYNRLHRKGVFKFPGDAYVAVANADVVDSIKANLTGWTDVQKYADAVQVLKNEIGMFAGFRWITSSGNEATADGGNGTVDSYTTLFFGRNALGRVVSYPPTLKITGPFDKLGRMVNVGWTGIVKYGIVDQDALWTIVSASEFGDNA